MNFRIYWDGDLQDEPANGRSPHFPPYLEMERQRGGGFAFEQWKTALRDGKLGELQLVEGDPESAG